MPFFFDLSSLIPIAERNPFEPVVVNDDEPVQHDIPETTEAAQPDFGLPIPTTYIVDLMRALVQDPFHLFVHWQLKDDPFTRLSKMFPPTAGGQEDFHTVLKLVDETNAIAVFFNAAYTSEYWFQVYPDRTYRVELGVKSSRHGFIKLLASQPVRMPRGAPSDQSADEAEYSIGADEYLKVLRESHLVPERAFTPQGLLPQHEADERAWQTLPASFQQLLTTMADIQGGRDYERWWEKLSSAELADWVREFLRTLQQMGGDEMGYLLLLSYLPELLRRAVLAELGEGAEAAQLEIDKPIALYMSEKLGLGSSEQRPTPPVSPVPGPALPNAPGSLTNVQWLPSMNR
ncbi:MAG: DUF4912 domain-containing protein [Acidobacteria bacterium]|nr:DUF4912 domain-containing protein [Acidobacteriota bacterium]